MILALLLACTRPIPPTPPVPPAAAPTPLQRYEAALDDARFPQPSEVAESLLVLSPETPGLRWDDAGRLLVATWTRGLYYADPVYTQGHVFPLYGETWFTAGEEVRMACQGLGSPGLERRLEELLGLPPGGDRDAFLLVWIDPGALFRPCAQPDVSLPGCPLLPPLMAGEGDAVSWNCDGVEGHARWLCDNWIRSYSASEPTRRFPWTALGYTHDWGSTGDPIGPSEFVAPKGTEVRFEALVPTAAYCAG